MNYKFTAVQFEGQVMGVSELLSHLFYDPSEEADREMDNKTMQVHVSPGAMGPGRMQHTVVGDVAFPEAFFFLGWMPSLAPNSRGLTMQQREVFGVLPARRQASQMKPEKADSPAMAACIPCNCLTTSNWLKTEGA